MSITVEIFNMSLKFTFEATLKNVAWVVTTVTKSSHFFIFRKKIHFMCVNYNSKFPDWGSDLRVFPYEVQMDPWLKTSFLSCLFGFLEKNTYTHILESVFKPPPNAVNMWSKLENILFSIALSFFLSFLKPYLPGFSCLRHTLQNSRNYTNTGSYFRTPHELIWGSVFMSVCAAAYCTCMQ